MRGGVKPALAPQPPPSPPPPPSHQPPPCQPPRPLPSEGNPGWLKRLRCVSWFAPLQSTTTDTIAAMTATQTPTKAIVSTGERSVTAGEIADSDPKSTAIQIRFLKTYLPARFGR